MSRGLPIVERRVKELEKGQGKQDAATLAYTWDQLGMSVSCPPDTQLHIRAGWGQRGSYWVAQSTVWLPELAVDFTDASQFVNYTGSFTNADYYMPMLLRYDNDYFYNLYVGGDTSQPINDYPTTSVEYATAGEAEAAAESWFDGATALYNGRLPLCVVILKNNGTTGTEGQVLPVDTVNRGRSYFYRDVRPRNVCPYFEW